jgi:hypothetical protein
MKKLSLNKMITRLSKLIGAAAFLLIGTMTFAQAPQKMSYQAVIRNPSNVLVASTTVGMKISILQGSPVGTPVYVETQTPTTNINGLASIQIGTGTIVTGTFAGINWSAGPYYVKTETDPLGGISYTITGTSQLMSVPYALLAAKANIPDGATNGDMLYWNGTAWVILPIDAVGKVLKIDPSGIPTWVTPVTSALPPTVTTDNTSSILAQSANVQGTAVNGNGELIITRGFCYNTSPTPTVANSIVQSGAGVGVFNSNLSGLTANTLYYVRAFATSIAGTSYGTQLTFTTQNGVVALTTTAASSINTCNAISGGNISSDGGSAVYATGVCYNTSPNPTTANFTGSGFPTNVFTATLTPLTASTTYYYRAYATNSVGTSYGNELNFTTQNGVATLTTTLTSNSACKATINYLVTNTGASALTNSGLVYGTSPSPTLSNSVLNYNPNYPYYMSVDGSYPGYGSPLTVNGLTASTTYYVRSFATNCAGTTYGPQVTFTTTNGAATLTTAAATTIGGCGAKVSYVVTNTGGEPITNSGLVYATTTNPTLSNSVQNYNPNAPYYMNADGSFPGYGSQQPLSGLAASTTYYVRSFATNCAGTTYGPQVSFTTLSGIISLTTGTYLNIDPCKVEGYSGTTIISNNGGPISAQGVCYNTSTNPTIANNIGNTYDQSFVALPNTTYYVRSYATSCSGVTYYGNEITLTSPIGITSILTAAATLVTAGTATLNGTVNTSGSNYGYITMGFCYGTSPTPTIANTVADWNIENGSYTFAVPIIGLTASTTYYYRTYGIGYSGIQQGACVPVTYGPIQSFTTPAGPKVVGQAFGGGIIISTNGVTGIIAALTDQGFADWGCEGTTMGANGTASGTGQANTTTIVGGCATAGIAARICDNLVLSGFNNWHLPSEAEAILIGQVGYFPVENIWTSTEVSSTQARYVNGTSPSNNNKSYNAFKVRAVRNF